MARPDQRAFFYLARHLCLRISLVPPSAPHCWHTRSILGRPVPPPRVLRMALLRLPASASTMASGMVAGSILSDHLRILASRLRVLDALGNLILDHVQPVDVAIIINVAVIGVSLICG